MTFEERIKELTTPQLKRLIAILDQIDGKTIHEFDALIASLKTPQPVLSEKAANLIGARTYELQIYNFLDPEIAHAQAMEEFRFRRSAPQAAPSSPLY